MYFSLQKTSVPSLEMQIYKKGIAYVFTGEHIQCILIKFACKFMARLFLNIHAFKAHHLEFSIVQNLMNHKL